MRFIRKGGRVIPIKDDRDNSVKRIVKNTISGAKIGASMGVVAGTIGIVAGKAISNVHNARAARMGSNIRMHITPKGAMRMMGRSTLRGTATIGAVGAIAQTIKEIKNVKSKSRTQR